MFLSHSSRDAWLASVVKDRIEHRIRGVEVWLDEMSLTGGEEVLRALKAGISQAHELVVIVSNESLRSQWVAWEIGMAEGQRKRITPLLNNVDHDAMAPLKGVKSYELNLFEKFLLELTRRASKS
ncbi:MAG TPA: toll/interleukin-1 receptor domain-containing protein [Terriglobia bacterium]|nr:toll/interleukin-1 receptor domain-containing protein [Terriglobia bacterium]